MSKIIQGNCIEILKTIESNSIDCCITDPPYNITGSGRKEKIGWLKSNKYWAEEKKIDLINESWDNFSDSDYESFTISWLSEIKRILKPNGNIIIFGSFHNIYTVGYILKKMDLKIINSIVWFKRNAFPNITGRMFCESTEHIIWATNNNIKKAKNWTFNYKTMKELNGGKQMRNMFDIPNTKASEKKLGKHPAQKPIELLENLILAVSNENDIIIDPFLGSGTTALVAKKNNRNYIGIEIDEKYVKIAKDRIANL
jgi:site-specific DNA-methyltransferase (adenine-specific)